MSFATLFATRPAVLAGVQSANDGEPVITRVSQVTAAGFRLAMDEEQAKRDGHGTETLGWIALERGSASTSDGRSLRIFEGAADDRLRLVGFGQSFDRLFPVLLADVVSARGEDPVVLRYQSLTPNSVRLFLQEEQSQDAEVKHTSETLSIFVAE